MTAETTSVHRRRQVVAGAFAALTMAVLVLAYLGIRTQAPARDAPAEKLRIALAMNPQSALIQIAMVNGYFVEEGLDLTVTPTAHGKVGIDLLVAGKVDLASAAEVPFVLQVLAGQPLSMAASLLTTSNQFIVVARRDHGILTPRDLSKKKIGVVFGTTSEYFLWAFLIRQKLPPASVTLVDVPQGQIVQALVDGSIDALASWQPNVAAAQSALGANAQSFSEANTYTETNVVVGRSAFLSKHPQTIQKFIRALLNAEHFNRTEPESALQLVAERLKIGAPVLRSFWSDFNFRVNLLQSQLITLEDEARWAMERGYAQKGPVHNFLPNLYLEALLAVRPERVTVVR
jgi:ABC-type nitrate/sulfonate/bicarbonate transport system substrate-binding protein